MRGCLLNINRQRGERRFILDQDPPAQDEWMRPGWAGCDCILRDWRIGFCFSRLHDEKNQNKTGVRPAILRFSMIRCSELLGMTL